MSLFLTAPLLLALVQTAVCVDGGVATCSSGSCASKEAEDAAVVLMQTNIRLSSENRALESTEFAEFSRLHEETQRKKADFFNTVVKTSSLSDAVKKANDDFQTFLASNPRDYADKFDAAEYTRRLEVFAQKKQKIDERNAHEQSANTHPHKATHGVTKYADWTEDEFKALLGHRSRRQEKAKGHGMAFVASIAGSQAIPARAPSLVQTTKMCTKNYASSTTMRNQGNCGSCWAFATATTLRASYIQQHGVDPGKLSTQFIVDCMHPHETCKGGVNGCCGGFVEHAMEWIQANGGIPTQAAYGDYYTSLLQAGANTSRSQGGPVSPGSGLTFSGNHPTTRFPCKSTGIPKAVTYTGNTVSLKTEDDMANYLCDHGPFAVGVDASAWDTYTGGVMTASSCATETNHAVTVIGMDKKEGVWIIQNQWGADFGVSLDGKRPPKDSYGICPDMAKSPGCNAYVSSDPFSPKFQVKTKCALSCSHDPSDGGYIFLKFGENTCGITDSAVAVNTTKSAGGSTAPTHAGTIVE